MNKSFKLAVGSIPCKVVVDMQEYGQKRVKSANRHGGIGFFSTISIRCALFLAFWATAAIATEHCGADLDCYLEQERRAITRNDLDTAIQALESAQQIQPDAARADRLARLKTYRRLFSAITASKMEPAAQQWLFRGQMTDAWQPYALAGGNFERFARFDAG